VSEERRVVTILFSDIVGSTALGESLDPEDVRALLSRYFAIAKEVVASHGGTLEKFIGDAVLAVFGLPSAHGDDPARALAAALELRDRLQADPVLGERTPTRFGVNTGEVVATRQASGDDALITGDAVNTAARLEQAAEPWEILIGERTAASAGATFAIGPPRGVEAKGKAEPVPARVLLGRAAAPAPRRLPLVGRDDDLAQLELVGRRAFGEQRPYLVSILAPAGTGKTRLLEEFLDRLPVAAGDAKVAITQCLPYGQRLTYSPLKELLVGIVEATGDPSPDELRATARTWLQAAGDADADRSADLLAATLGATEIENVDRAALFAAWRSLVEKAASQRPLVLVIEDLHWSSDSLLDLIEALLQPRGAAPILMLVLARPELLDRRPTWGGGRRNYVALALEPLGDASVATLVDDLLGRQAPDVAERVVARAEGNPFYAGEIVRTILERAPGLTQPAVDQALASLPDTVQATVLARIDLLGEQARRVLQVGSVFGRSFPVGGLIAAEPGLADPADGLDQLVDRDLVRPSAGDDFTFRHILIREVAYGTLPRAERSRLHAAAATYLADTANGRSDELAELIAYHFREAATVGGHLGTVPEEVRQSAVVWLRRAADAAMAGAANFEAARHLRSAIDLAQRDDIPDLQRRLGDVFMSGDEAIAAYHAALTAARELGREPDELLALMTSELVVWTRWSGSVASDIPDRRQELLVQVEDLLPKTTDRRSQSRFFTAKSFQEGRDFRSEAARADAQTALAIARDMDDPDLISGAYDALGSAALAEDDYEGFLGVTRERLELDERISVSERMDAWNMMAWGLGTLGRFEESLSWSTAITTSLAPEQAITFQLGATAWQISMLHLLGRWDEVIVRARRLQELWEDADRTAAGFALHGWLAVLEVARARRDEELAASMRSTIEHIARRFDEGTRSRRQLALLRPDPPAVVRDVIEAWQAWTGNMESLDRPLLVCADRLEPADPALLRRIIEHMDAKKIRIVGAQARRLLGLVTGDPDPLRRSLATFEEAGARPYVARVQADLGTMTGDDGLHDQGIAALEALGDADHLGRLAARRSGRAS